MVKKPSPLRISAAGFFLVVLTVELVTRISGIVDFPVYQVDSEIGYIPQANQHGAFLRHNHWAFNDRSMGTEEPWSPSIRPNILLIGNSIVMGGNPYDQKDKLGALIQKEVGTNDAVWPIAAGGWTNVNETVYLKRNPDIVKAATYFVWGYMSGGLSGLSEWRGNFVFPKSRPVCASCYAFRRYILPRILPLNMNELPPTGALNAAHLAAFRAAVETLSHAATSKERGMLFLYPKKAEYLLSLQGKEWLPERAEIEKIASEDGLKIVDIAQAKAWNETFYREDGVHPTVEGNAVLAKILVNAR